MAFTRQEILARLRASKPALQAEFPLQRLALFGSCERGTQIAGESDVDILVEVEPSVGLRFVTLAERLEEILGERVDLVSHRAIKPSLWKRIEPELIDVFTSGFLTATADLQTRADLKPSDVARLADSEVDDRATAILQLGHGLPAASPGPNQPGAADVGLNAGKLDLLETRIETYNFLLGTPRAVRGEKSAATANLQQAFDDIDKIYEKGLDKLVEQFRGTNFYQEYQSARKIDDPGSRRVESTPQPATPTMLKP